MLRLQVHHAHWATAFCQGRFDDTLRHASLGSTLCGDGPAAETMLDYGNHHAGVCASAFAARALAAAGRRAEAQRAAAAAVASARGCDHAFSLVLALTFAAATSQTVGDRGDVAARAAEAEAIAARHGFRLLSAWARALAGWAAASPGASSAAVDTVRDAVASAFATGSGQFRTYFLALLADAHLLAGQRRDGLAVLDEAFDWARRMGERFHEAELHRLRGELLMLDDSTAGEAVQAFTQGVVTAQLQGAHLFSLRNTAALQRLGVAVEPDGRASARPRALDLHESG